MAIPKDQDGNWDIAAGLEINQLNLELEICVCASDYYRVSCMAAEAKDNFETASMSLEIYESELADNSMKGRDAKKDKITQTEIKRQFRDDSRWQRLRGEVLKLQHNYAIFEKAAKAYEIKGHMIGSLNKRQLAKAGMGIQHLSDE